MSKLLILGGSSFVGRAVAKQMAGGKHVSTFRRTPPPGGLRFDPLEDDLEAILHDHGPFSHALLLYGITAPDRCWADPEDSRRVNVESMKRCLETLVRRDVRPVFTSSEVVFDGKRGNYEETDVPNPLLLYGRQKLEVEQFCARLTGPWTIVRLARVVGTRPRDGTLFTDWLGRMQTNTPIRCATDSRFSPIHVEDAAAQIIALVREHAGGIVHVGGVESPRRWKMLLMLTEAARQAGLRSSSDIAPCALDNIPTPEPRPRDVSMRVERMLAITGIRPRSVGSIVAECVRNAHPAGPWVSDRIGLPTP